MSLKTILQGAADDPKYLSRERLLFDNPKPTTILSKLSIQISMQLLSYKYFLHFES